MANRKGPFTPAEDERIRELHAAGTSCNGIARDLQRSPGSLHRHATEVLGLSFERPPQIVAANRAASIDYATRRSRIIDRTYSQLEAMLDRLEAPSWSTVLRGEGGSERVDVLDFIPPNDLRAIHGAMAQAAMTAMRLEAVDNSGAKQVASLLTGLADKMGIEGL